MISADLLDQLREKKMHRGVILFTAPTCHKCAQLKSHLKSCNIAFTEMDVTTAEGRTELLISGVACVYLPILMIGDRVLEYAAIFDEHDNLLDLGEFLA